MLKKLARSQKGFTLLELIIVIALTGIISTAAAMSIHQIFTGTAFSNDQNTAINQVRNAAYWISRDAQMAQPDEIKGSNLTLGRFLQLKWNSFDSNTTHAVNYTLEDMPGNGLKKLKRSETINSDSLTNTLIAQYIKPMEEEETWCSWNSTEKILTVNITAQVGGRTEKRTFQVEPRPD